MSSREVVEGRQRQGVDEKIPYQITTTPWGTAPAAVSAIVKDKGAGMADVTSSVMPGGASVSGNVITLSKLIGLTAGRAYRVEVKFDCGGVEFECYFWVDAEL